MHSNELNISHWASQHIWGRFPAARLAFPLSPITSLFDELDKRVPNIAYRIQRLNFVHYRAHVVVVITMWYCSITSGPQCRKVLFSYLRRGRSYCRGTLDYTPRLHCSAAYVLFAQTRSRIERTRFVFIFQLIQWTSNILGALNILLFNLRRNNSTSRAILCFNELTLSGEVVTFRFNASRF